MIYPLGVPNHMKAIVLSGSDRVVKDLAKFLLVLEIEESVGTVDVKFAKNTILIHQSRHSHFIDAVFLLARPFRRNPCLLLDEHYVFHPLLSATQMSRSTEAFMCAIPFFELIRLD